MNYVTLRLNVQLNEEDVRDMERANGGTITREEARSMLLEWISEGLDRLSEKV